MMKNKELETRLGAAFREALPDVGDEIVRRASDKNAGALMIVSQVDRRRQYRSYAAIAAAILVLVVGAVFTAGYVQRMTTDSTVTVEGAERYEIELNHDRRPLSINEYDPVTHRAVWLKGQDCATLGEAVDCVIDRMLDAGTLNPDCNTVLITVSSDPDRAADELSDATAAARGSFDEAAFDGAVLGTVASDDRDVRRIARRRAISLGKAAMVREIMTALPEFGEEELSRLSVNDLNLLSLYRGVTYRTITACGVPHGCITPEQAAQIAQEIFGASAVDVALGCSDGGLIYRVTVKDDGGAVFIGRLSAVTGEVLPVDEPDEPTAPSEPTEPVAPTTLPTAPTAPTVPASTERTAPTQPIPTQAEPTQPKPPTPTQPEPTAPEPTAPEPEAFTGDSYLPVDSTPSTQRPGENARSVAITRMINGYDVFFDRTSFPYTAAGQQGGITALVCSREQFVRLTGSGDDRFDDGYFATHALYIHMNRDADCHWIKSVQGAYMDGGTLFIESGEPVGYYITTDDANPERIYTVVWELNKAELSDLVNVREFEE